MEESGEPAKIYYLIDGVGLVKFRLIAFLRSIKNLNFLSYIKSVLVVNERPIGGHKIAYMHCALLRKSGVDAIPVRMGRFKGDFFGFDLEVTTYNNIKKKVRAKDVVVASEFCPYYIEKFKKGKKIVFVQNWINIDRRLKKKDIGKSYLDIGFQYVITCGSYVTEIVREKMQINSVTITNGIDLQMFFSDPSIRKENRILCLPRKNHADILKIKEIVIAKYPNADFVEAHKLTEEEIALEYRKSDIFLATGYPEGFGLPPLEAMASGCAVVGFTGRGASEFMIHNQTALVAEDGDCEIAASHLLKLLDSGEEKERLRGESKKMAINYSHESLEQKLIQFYSPILEGRAT